MEGIRPDSEDDDKDDLSTSKKKRSDKTGLFNFDFKIEKPKKDVAEKREDLLSLLTRKTVEVDNSEATDEVPEEVELLSPSEELQIEKQIILEHQAEYHTETESVIDEQTFAELEAVDIFHDKILSEDLDSTQALAETLAEISSSEEFQDENSEIIDLHQPAEKLELTEEPVAIRKSIFEFKPVDKSSEKINPKESTSTTSVANPIFDRIPNVKEAPKKSQNTVSEIVDKLLVRKQNDSKAEKNPTQVKKKIEAQVNKIKEEIITKELAVRQAAVENVKTRIETAQETSSRTAAPEANHLHSTVAPEKIGKVLMKAEANKSTPRVETATLKPIDEHIETISRADLLELSSKTLVDGSTLRQAYETNLITEKGLRRVLIEHLRGGDIKRALRRELVEHERDFERDPQLRDKPRQTQVVNNSVKNLVNRVAPDVINYEIEQPLTLNSQISITKNSKKQQKSRFGWLDIGLLLIIAILLTLVLILINKRQ